MKKTVKALVLITMSACIHSGLFAQLRLPTIGNNTGKELRIVIEDYPNHFANIITGEPNTEANGTATYICKGTVSDAEESSVTKHAGKKSPYSWEATMLTTENFDKARQKFKALFGQVNNLGIHLDGHSYKLKGDYKAPSEEMKFTSAVFSLYPDDEPLKKFRTELVLQFHAPVEWKVKLLVYEKDREDDERGEQREGN